MTALSSHVFVARNLFGSFRIPPIKDAFNKGYSIIGLNRKNAKEAFSLLEDIDGAPLVSKTRKMLYWFISRKMIFLLHENSGCSAAPRLLGINIYYFNKYDALCRINTIHEAFIGVHVSRRGQGIATLLRQAAFNHFKSTTLDGITTRIKKDNQASLVSAQKLGFVVTPELLKCQLDDDEHYMIRNLR